MFPILSIGINQFLNDRLPGKNLRNRQAMAAEIEVTCDDNSLSIEEPSRNRFEITTALIGQLWDRAPELPIMRCQVKMKHLRT